MAEDVCASANAMSYVNFASLPKLLKWKTPAILSARFKRVILILLTT
jgi:hypothetical protein